MLKFRKGRKLGVASREGGFSLTELLVVLGILAILLAISVPYLASYRKVYRSDDQAIKIMDLMREAGQLALTRRRTFRFEIDLTENAVLIIDENGANPDRRIKTVPLDRTSDVRVDTIPAGVAKPNPPNYNDITFAADTVGHLNGATNVTGHSVWAARFNSDGSVVNTAATPTPISVNIYVFPPVTNASTTPRSMQEVRCITMFGGSGAIRYWRHNGTAFTSVQ